MTQTATTSSQHRQTELLAKRAQVGKLTRSELKELRVLDLILATSFAE